MPHGGSFAPTSRQLQKHQNSSQRMGTQPHVKGTPSGSFVATGTVAAPATCGSYVSTATVAAPAMQASICMPSSRRTQGNSLTFPATPHVTPTSTLQAHARPARSQAQVMPQVQCRAKPNMAGVDTVDPEIVSDLLKKPVKPSMQPRLATRAPTAACVVQTVQALKPQQVIPKRIGIPRRNYETQTVQCQSPLPPDQVQRQASPETHLSETSKANEQVLTPKLPTKARTQTTNMAVRAGVASSPMPAGHSQSDEALVQSRPLIRKPDPPQTLQKQKQGMPLLDIPILGEPAESNRGCDVALIEGIEILDPEDVFDVLRSGDTVLVDVRDSDRASGVIHGAHHVPAIDDIPFPHKVPDLVRQYMSKRLVVFMCQYSRHRAPQCANMYGEQAAPHQRVAVLAGGFRGWEAKGLPVIDVAATSQESMQADAVALRHGVEFIRQGMHISSEQKETQAQQLKDRRDQQVRIPKLPESAQPLLDIPPVGPQPEELPVTGKFGVPTFSGVDIVEPVAVHSLLKSGDCLLVDVRDEDRAAGLIEGSVHVPAIDTVPFPDKVPELIQRFAQWSCVLFTCQYSRHRAPQCASWYREQADPAQRVGVLSGGFRGWEAHGLPIVQSNATTAEAQAADEIATKHGQHFVKYLVPQAYSHA